MKKLLIIQDKVMHYRIPLFKLLAESYDLTIIYTDKGDKTELEYTNIQFIPVKSIKLGPINYQPGLWAVISKLVPDIIVATFDVRWLSVLHLMLFPRIEARLIWWGLDTGGNSFATKLKVNIAKRTHSILFYCNSNKQKFIELGVPRRLCFVANNTFDVGERVEGFNYQKNSFLFVGSFDKRKKIENLIDVFIDTLPFLPEGIKLNLIGDGECFEEIQTRILNEKLSEHVVLTGRINNPECLLDYYKAAYSSISYGQAGLSILQSFGFGVPYITHEKAISGGEIDNLISGFNGYLFTTESTLKNKMIELTKNEKYISFGVNSYDTYSAKCTIENMCKSFIAVIEANDG